MRGGEVGRSGMPMENWEYRRGRSKEEMRVHSGLRGFSGIHSLRFYHSQDRMDGFCGFNFLISLEKMSLISEQDRDF